MLKINMNSELIKKFYKILEEINLNMENENYNEALQLIEKSFKEFFRLSSKFFYSLSEENLMDIIKTNNIIDIHKSIIMSKLIMIEGTIYEKLGKSSHSFYLYEKSLYLYLESSNDLDEESELLQFKPDILFLIEKTSEYKLSEKLQKKIIEYYLNEGEYDKGENVLYDLLEDHPELKDYGISFYNNLLLKEDYDLNKGRLPRDEILESLNSLK